MRARNMQSLKITYGVCMNEQLLQQCHLHISCAASSMVCVASVSVSNTPRAHAQLVAPWIPRYAVTFLSSLSHFPIKSLSQTYCQIAANPVSRRIETPSGGSLTNCRKTAEELSTNERSSEVQQMPRSWSRAVCGGQEAHGVVGGCSNGG